MAKKRFYLVTCAAVYPNRRTKTMRRRVEATNPKQAAILAVSKRKDYGFAFIVLQAPVMVFEDNEGLTFPLSSYVVDLERGNYIARRHKLRNEKRVAREVKKVS